MSEIEDLREALVSAQQLAAAREARLRQQEIVLSGLQAIRADDEPDAAIPRAFELLREALTFERAMVLQPKGDRFACVASTEAVALALGLDWPAGPFLTRVARGRGAVVPDASQVPEWTANPLRLPPPVGAIFAPLTTAEGPGLLVLCADKHGAYSAADLNLVVKLGLIVSQTLETAYRRRLTDAVRRSEVEREAAVQANEAKSRFFANMSHEIRTPLNGVVAMAEVLSRSELAPRDREMADVILDSGRMLERLLNDVLDFAKMEAGHLELEPRPFNLRADLKSVFDLSAAKADAKGLHLKIAEADMAKGWFIGDSLRVRQVVTNLLSNAVKFTDAGQVEVTVDVEPEGADLRVAIRVRDSGCGFPAEAAERLFGRFEQEDSSITRRFGGTGLGLPISRSLARLMGGDIVCRSSPHEGSVFEFTFRATRAEAPGGLSDRVGVLTFENGPSVLVVEDNPTNQKIIGVVLDMAGIVPSYANNGEEACEMVTAERFDVILMDLQMPVMDGLTAIRCIRARERETGAPPTPIIAVSADAMVHQVEEALAVGADAHIAKPISPGALLTAIGEACSRPGSAPAHRGPKVEHPRISSRRRG